MKFFAYDIRHLKYHGYCKYHDTSKTVVFVHVALSHLRSKEITGIHKLCIPHSNDSSATTEYKPFCIQM